MRLIPVLPLAAMRQYSSLRLRYLCAWLKVHLDVWQLQRVHKSWLYRDG
ncbi:MAG: hypothetical protein FWH37_06990 [Candidatus Bathyarchaeota archaeon]|nr:hypothetical protein [Candidatus Termiticorpusculum sp.]